MNANTKATTLGELINARYQDTRAGICHPDACSNCEFFSDHLRVGHILGEADEDRSGYVCKKFSHYYAKNDKDNKLFVLPKLMELNLDTPIEEAKCSEHKRTTCLRCKKPVNHQNTSICDECIKADFEKRKNDPVINILTGEVVGTVQDFETGDPNDLW